VSTPRADRAKAGLDRLHDALGRPALKPADAKDAREAAALARRVAELATPEPEPGSPEWAGKIAAKHSREFASKAVRYRGMELDERRNLESEGVFLKTDTERKIRAAIALFRRLSDENLELAARARDIANGDRRRDLWCCFARRVLATCSSAATFRDLEWQGVFEAYLEGEAEAMVAFRVDDRRAANSDLPEPAETDDD